MADMKVSIIWIKSRGSCAIRVCKSPFILQKGNGFVAPHDPSFYGIFLGHHFADTGSEGVVEIFFTTTPSPSEECSIVE